MPLLRTRMNDAGSRSDGTPYPSWPSIADDMGWSGDPSQDTQCKKEARIWRALAEEPLQDEQDEASDSTDGGATRRF